MREGLGHGALPEEEAILDLPQKFILAPGPLKEPTAGARLITEDVAKTREDLMSGSVADIAQQTACQLLVRGAVSSKHFDMASHMRCQLLIHLRFYGRWPHARVGGPLGGKRPDTVAHTF